MLKNWAKEVDATGEEKLKLNLLAYDEKAEIPGILRVNFDPKLVKLLRETKYFMLLDSSCPRPLARFTSGTKRCVSKRVTSTSSSAPSTTSSAPCSPSSAPRGVQD